MPAVALQVHTAENIEDGNAGGIGTSFDVMDEHIIANPAVGINVEADDKGAVEAFFVAGPDFVGKRLRHGCFQPAAEELRGRKVAFAGEHIGLKIIAGNVFVDLYPETGRFAAVVEGIVSCVAEVGGCGAVAVRFFHIVCRRVKRNKLEARPLAGHLAFVPLVIYCRIRGGDAEVVKQIHQQCNDGEKDAHAGVIGNKAKVFHGVKMIGVSNWLGGGSAGWILNQRRKNDFGS